MYLDDWKQGSRNATRPKYSLLKCPTRCLSLSDKTKRPNRRDLLNLLPEAAKLWLWHPAFGLCGVNGVRLHDSPRHCGEWIWTRTGTGIGDLGRVAQHMRAAAAARLHAKYSILLLFFVSLCSELVRLIKRVSLCLSQLPIIIQSNPASLTLRPVNSLSSYHWRLRCAPRRPLFPSTL